MRVQASHLFPIQALGPPRARDARNGQTGDWLALKKGAGGEPAPAANVRLGGQHTPAIYLEENQSPRPGGSRCSCCRTRESGSEPT
jgi:hypothetical protein